MNQRLPEPDADAAALSRQLVELLRGEIERAGPVSFAHYMERCLYAPAVGYYSAGATKFGGAGDFVTAPELGPVFARCVARALAALLRALDGVGEVLELGGGSGAFAAAVLPALAELDVIPRAYRILEPSADLRERQRERLQAALPPELLQRVAWPQRPPEEAWQGVVFGNEVIDALPATRFSIHDQEVQEACVDWVDGHFAWVDRPADAMVGTAVRHVEQYLGTRLDEGYRSEILPQLPYWLDAVAGTLQRGAMLWVDYGYVRADYYRADRREGTLRAHYRQRAHDDVFAWPGLQDLTASVDFTALAEAGFHAGFELAAYLPQSQFLIGNGLDEVFAAAHAQAADEVARYALAQQVKHLTLPGQMGQQFQAMLLTRGLDVAQAVDARAREFDLGSRL